MLKLGKLALRNSEATAYMIQIAEAIQAEDYNNVVNDALNEVSNNLKIEMISSIDSLYQKYLLNFQSIIKKEIEEIYKENLNYLVFNLIQLSLIFKLLMERMGK